MDDFNGKFCKNGTFPIIRSVSDCFKGSMKTTTVEVETTTITITEEPTTTTTTRRKYSKTSKARRTTTTRNPDIEYEEVEFTDDDLEYYENYDDESDDEGSRANSIFNGFNISINAFLFFVVRALLF